MNTNNKDLGARGGKDESQVGHASLGQGGGGQSQSSDVGRDASSVGREAAIGKTTGGDDSMQGNQERRGGS